MRMRTWMVCFAGLLLCLAAPASRLHGADEMTIDSAIECLADEDAATRKKAEDFLRAAGDKAVPALKKAMAANDPEIRKRAAALLTIAKRAPIVLKIVDQAGKPMAGLTFQVIVLKAEDANRVWVSGTQVSLNDAKPIYQGEVKTDDKGILKTEEFNQDKYSVCVTTGEGLPAQGDKLEVEIKDNAEPVEWKIRRGAAVKIKVVDENDKPLAGASILFNDRWGDFSPRQLANTSDRKLAKQLENQAADTKTAADGTLTLKKLLAVPNGLTVFLSGYARQTKTGIAAEDGQETDLGVIKLVPLKKSAVTITLVDKDMKPLKGLTVVVVDAENRYALHGYVDQKQLPKVLEWKYAHAAGPSDDKGVATVQLDPGSYAFAVANGETSSLTWVSQVENGMALNCGTVVLP